MVLIYRETELQVKDVGGGMIGLPKYGIYVSIEFLSDTECLKRLKAHGLPASEVEVLIEFLPFLTKYHSKKTGSIKGDQL